MFKFSFTRCSKFFDSVIVLLSTLIFLISFRPKSFFYPIYWDAIMGPFYEAIWLLENDFNFIKLATSVAGFDSGGACVYLFSWYPAAQALFIKFCSSVSTFLFINHCLSVVFASCIVGVLYIISRTCFSRFVSLVIVLLLVFNPLFLAQAYAINMEIPVLFFSIVVVSLYLKNKHKLAIFFLIVAFYLKETAVVVSIVLACSFLIGRKKDTGKIGFFYLLPCVLFLVHRLISFYVFNNQAQYFFSFMHNLCLFGGFLKRDPVLFLCLNFVVFVTPFNLFRQYQKSNLDINLFFSKNKLCIISYALCLIFYVMIFMLWLFLSRYYLFCLPFMLICFVWNLLYLNRVVMILMVTVFMIFNLFFMFRSDIFLLRHNSNDGSLFERSLEYEDDIQANLLLVDLLQEKFSDKTVVTSWPFVHMLISDKYGYVKTPMSVVASDVPVFKWKQIPELKDIVCNSEEDAKAYVWVWCANGLPGKKNMPDVTRDILEYTIEKGASKIFVFTKPLESFIEIQKK